MAQVARIESGIDNIRIFGPCIVDVRGVSQALR